MKAIFNKNNLKHPLILAPLLLTAASACANSQKDGFQCVLVENAQIASMSLAKEGKFGHANHGHQIVAGGVTKGGYWWAKDPFSRIQFRRDSTGLYATLKQSVHATYAAMIFPQPPKSIPVDVTCLVRKMSVIELTPWVGRVGTSWLSFYSQGDLD